MIYKVSPRSSAWIFPRSAASVNSKYVQTNYGVFSLRHFSAIPSAQWTERGIEQEVKKSLKALIDAEDPLSHSATTNWQNCSTHRVSTSRAALVAKYREAC